MGYKKIRDHTWGGLLSQDDPKGLNKKDTDDVRRYLRLFERIYFALEDGAIKGDVVRKMWGYRIKQVTNDDKVCTMIFKNKDIKGEPWESFIKLWEKLYKSDYNNKRKQL